MISSAKMTPGWTGGRRAVLRFDQMFCHDRLVLPSVVLLQIDQVAIAIVELERDAPRTICGHAVASMSSLAKGGD
jgi:hypothetical protein